MRRRVRRIALRHRASTCGTVPLRAAPHGTASGVNEPSLSSIRSSKQHCRRSTLKTSRYTVTAATARIAAEREAFNRIRQVAPYRSLKRG